MAKSGFVPAWMKIPSSDKSSPNQKFSFNRTNHSPFFSTRQRHHSSDLVDQANVRQSSEHIFSFPFRSTTNSHSSEENRFLSRKDRLLSTPASFDQRTNDRKNTNSYHQLTKQTIRLLSLPETNEEKDLLKRMGWNDEMTYEITDKDKEEYEKRIKLFPKMNNHADDLITALNRRTLPYINIRDLLRFEKIDSISDDDDLDE